MSDAEEFANHEVRVFKLLSKAGFAPHTIFDIGAANGVWSAMISNEVFPEASFHLFEPLAGLMPLYQEHLQYQMKWHPKFHLHPVALGADNKRISMRVHADGYSSTILDMGEHREYQARQEVPQYTLDDFVERFELPLPDVIKLDTQGAERIILSHARRSLAHACVVFAEAWLARGYGPETPLITELAEVLAEHDYTLVELGHCFYREQHELYSCDAYFFKRSFAARMAQAMPKESW